MYRNVFSNGQSGDSRESTQISGVNIGLGKRLQVPDDFFIFRNSIGFQQYKLDNSQSFFSFTDGTSNDFSYSITLERESVDQITYPRRGSFFSLNLKVTPPYSIFDNVDDYSNMSEQERYKYMEYYKWNFKSKWYSAITDKLILATSRNGLLSMYNKEIGLLPFGRFYLGGDGMSGMGYQFDGRELISLRGYSNNSVSPQTGELSLMIHPRTFRYKLV